MSAHLALWAILVLSLVSTAASAPMMWEFRRELATAKARTANYAATGALLVIVGIADLALWWYVAVDTGLWVLGVIPTVSMVWQVATNAMTNAAKKADR